jgi:hypothetical protein
LARAPVCRARVEGQTSGFFTMEELMREAFIQKIAVNNILA